MVVPFPARAPRARGRSFAARNASESRRSTSTVVSRLASAGVPRRPPMAMRDGRYAVATYTPAGISCNATRVSETNR